MPKRVFDYFCPKYTWTVLLTGLGGVGLILITLGSVKSAPEANKLDLLRTNFVGLALGSALVLVSAGVSTYVKNCRVEIEDDKIRWYDWLNRLRVEANLSSAHLTPGLVNHDQLITTENGEIWVHMLDMPRFEALEAILRQDTPVSAMTAPQVAVYAFKDYSRRKFRIVLSGDGIEWTDASGTVRIVAQPEEILAVGPGPDVMIYTKRGWIEAPAALPQSEELIRAINTTLEARKRQATSST